MKESFKLIFTSDMHGNIVQYKKLFRLAKKEKCHMIIIGGDITPKDSSNRTINGQKNFLLRELKPALLDFKNNGGYDVDIVMIMGNDDFSINEHVLKSFEKEGLIKIPHNRSFKLKGGLKIFGYSFVPPTPFCFKDWEKYDIDEKSDSKNRIFRKYGVVSKSGLLKNGKINNVSIESDMKKLEKKNDNKKTIYVIHAPPFNTNLDITKNKEHVGSIAIKNFIEKVQPPITLHGHIHETVEMSGRFSHKIGSTFSFSSGNSHDSDKLSAIIIDTSNPKNAERIIF